MQAESHLYNRVRSLRRCEQAEARKEEAVMRSVAILLLMIGVALLSKGTSDERGPGVR